MTLYPISWDKAFELASEELLRQKIRLEILPFLQALMGGQVLADFIMLKVRSIVFLIYLVALVLHSKAILMLQPKLFYLT